ncbi:MAG TPA: 7-cyano-7-deazaguanine synthase [Pirellulales bacterium]|jgi:7-cyano-7-deazaguanine synthase|nr:7-cyano-7-deazaguanine synthase [Pirellulales bacterium]
MTNTSHSTAGLLASGGLDSSILLAHLLGGRDRVQPFYIRFGLAWQDAELSALGRFMAALDCSRLEPLVVLDMPVADLYGDHWSVTGHDAPGADTPDEAVYLPGRNLLLALKAAIWCQLHGVESLALAPLRSNPFPDVSADFFAHFEALLNRGPIGRVRIVRPFADLSKRQVMELGREYPLEHTFSCISPRGKMHCGACNKCAERQDAFRLIGRSDPTHYANGAVAVPGRRSQS